MVAQKATTSVVSSKMTTPPEPAMVLSLFPPPMSKGTPGLTSTSLMRASVIRASNSMGTSISLASSTGIELPPGMTPLRRRPPTMPPQYSSMSWRNGMPMGSSYTPGRFTCPDTLRTRVPPDLPTPSLAKAAPPRITMSGMFIRVSTLLTMVGWPKRPRTAGNGGFMRGQPRLPSSELSSEVSSPQM
jgi:hypothetical protein